MRAKILLITVTLLCIIGITKHQSKFNDSSNTILLKDRTIDVKRNPIQSMLTKKESKDLTFIKNGFSIVPVASYDISAVVVSRKYYNNDKDSKISPVDLALAWGELAQPDYRKFIKYSQRNRWYYYKFHDAPYSKHYIKTHSANNHIIPANNNILNGINKVSSNGSEIRLRGYLINIYDNSSDYKWKSSLSRGDDGNGACEVFYVISAQVGNLLYK